MYTLPPFKASNPDDVKQFMREYPFAMLIGVGEGNIPAATQIPFFIDEREGKLFLSGHIMKNTDHHKAFQHNPEVLTIFTGPHTYVSASWYTNPQQASTWNYMSVHVRGTLTFKSDDDLIRILERTTSHYENNEHSPASFHALPEEYVHRLSKAIECFEIEVRSVDHVFKLSQNRDKESFGQIIHKLEEGNADARKIAGEMRRIEGGNRQ